jgi:hypothetical protein
VALACAVRSPGHPEDVRIGRQEGGRTEGEALAALDREPSLLDCGGRVAREVTAAGDAWPERRICGPLHASLKCRVGEDVLVEAQLTAWADHAEELGERTRLIGHCAEHERDDGSVKLDVSPGSLSASPCSTEIGTCASAAASRARSRR